MGYEAEMKSSTHNLGLENLAYDDLLLVMQQLTPAYRLVFNLYVVDGLTHKEVGKKLNISEGTSKSNLHRAKKLLYDMVERAGKGKLKLKSNHGR